MGKYRMLDMNTWDLKEGISGGCGKTCKLQVDLSFDTPFSDVQYDHVIRLL